MTTAVERVIAALERAGCNPRERKTNEWTAYCPVHETDGQRHRPSLSVGVGDDGRVLLHCHGGCATEAVVEALGLQLADLMPREDNGRAPKKPQANAPGKTQTFATANEAIKALSARRGKPAAWWAYRDAKGTPVGVVVRWNRPDGGKEIRPISCLLDGTWCIGAMLTPRPLYRLPEILKADRTQPVVICEGEKAAEAAQRCGLLATTSAGGAQATGKTDWKPLAGRRVIVLPDNDDAGDAYARDVAQLALAAGAKEVRILDWEHIRPDRKLPAGYDLADAVAECSGDDELKGLRKAVEHAAEQAKPWHPEPPAGLPPAWQPFPVDVLPDPVRGLVVAGSKAMRCDPAFVALPCLAVLAGCVGNARTLRLKLGWDVPAILWTAVVGESGTMKTPAFRLALRALRAWEQRAWQSGKETFKEYEIAMTRWLREFARWKNRKVDSDPPERPEKPIIPRTIVADVTVERLATLLEEHPRGLLLVRDELSGWLASFDRYVQHGQSSADVAFWLSSYVREPVRVDRKSGGESIYVPRAAMSVCGTIQPRVLTRTLGEQHRENGLLARLLLAMPPRVPKSWTEARVDPSVVEAFGRVIDGLLRLELAVDDDGLPEPVPLKLSRDAKALWVAFYNRHGAEHVELDGDLAAAWAKLEEAAARLALVLHLARWAGGDPTADPGVVDARSMAAGITLAEWFKHETRRVYAVLDETDEDRDRRRLIEWIGRQGGKVTARDLQRSLRKYSKPGAAEAALADLVKHGLGHWASVSAGSVGGRPTRVFQLVWGADADKTSKNRGNNEVSSAPVLSAGCKTHSGDGPEPEPVTPQTPLQRWEL